MRLIAHRAGFGSRALIGCALTLGALAAQAQAWPTKPMVFMNPFAAGGGTDTFARPLAAKLDGYNWFFGAVHHTIVESLYTRARAHPGQAGAQVDN
jgi:tripartite-type tricarboxylate transporter receptor subunit TctC